MNYKKRLQKVGLVIVIILISSVVVKAQNPTLEQQYNNMVEEYETFKHYKVIPHSVLKDFYSQATDSVQQRVSRIRQLNSQIKTQQAEIDTLKEQLASVQAKLDKSNEINDTIFFIGIPFTKLGYHIMVWLIILVLVVVGLIVYFMYIRSNQVTTKSRKELQALKAEYEQHRDKSREQQVKLKRELQTAINTIDEMKRGRR